VDFQIYQLLLQFETKATAMRRVDGQRLRAAHPLA
jgi:hypothetical protein